MAFQNSVSAFRVAEAGEKHNSPDPFSGSTLAGNVRHIRTSLEDDTRSVKINDRSVSQLYHSNHMFTFGKKLPGAVDLPIVSLLAICLIPTTVFIFTLFLSQWDNAATAGSYIVLAAFSGVLAALVFGEADFYRTIRRFPLLTEYGKVLRNWLIVVGILGALSYFTGSYRNFSTTVLFSWSILTPLLLLASEFVTRKTLCNFVLQNQCARNAVIIGANRTSTALAERIAADCFLNICICDVIDDRNFARFSGEGPMRKSGVLSDAIDYMDESGVVLVFICLPGVSEDRVSQFIEELHDTTVSVYFVPQIPTMEIPQARLDGMLSIPLVPICESPIYGVRGIAKRVFDVILSTLALLVALPAFMAIAVAVKADSPGPVIYRQKRYGRDGEEFSVYKFRSMRVCEDGDDITQAKSKDPRVTKVGGFLRRTSLDELPQLINVLQGTMSFVGPRPHAVCHNEVYRKKIKGYMLRHKVRPGITGLAQINGYRGETETLAKMQARVECDLYYIRNWSLFLDLRIILETAWLIFRDKNAY
jgi:putative colanic acid biosynthesis UDP-glucose lipid carrier transferase